MQFWSPPRKQAMSFSWAVHEISWCFLWNCLNTNECKYAVRTGDWEFELLGFLLCHWLPAWEEASPIFIGVSVYPFPKWVIIGFASLSSSSSHPPSSLFSSSTIWFLSSPWLVFARFSFSLLSHPLYSLSPFSLLQHCILQRLPHLLGSLHSLVSIIPLCVISVMGSTGDLGLYS